MTPIRIRITLSQLYESTLHHSDWIKKFEMYRDVYLLDRSDTLNVWNNLRLDVEAVYDYRRYIGIRSVTIDDLRYWFPSDVFSTSSSSSNTNYNYNIMLQWINNDYDFIYTSHGLKLLRAHYLKPKEPIQCCMLRIAKCMLTKTQGIDYGAWEIFYKLIACGFLHAPSIMAEKANHERSGEDCRLLVATKNFNHTFVRQIEYASTLSSCGIDIGMNMSRIPSIGGSDNGQVHGGFRAVVKRLDAAPLINLYNRKPKITIYVSVHCDTIFEILSLKTDFCYIGILIPNHFMECLRNHDMWYLFPPNINFNNENLNDFYGDEYIIKYEQFIKYGIYTNMLPATSLMEKIITKIAETRKLYLIFEDYVNIYGNQRHLGKIKSLCSCATVTQYAGETTSASATQMHINFGMYHDFPIEFAQAQRYMRTLCWNDNEFTKAFTKMIGQVRYAFCLGFMAAWALNNVLGVSRKNREIAISPLGVYDMALLTHTDPIELCSIVSEAMYMGSIIASCRYSLRYNFECRHYKNSEFSQGRPQFVMRDIQPNADWWLVKDMMKRGMANSMLTAQAPTQYTAQLVGVVESVRLPKILTPSYGIKYLLILDKIETITQNYDVNRQMNMYIQSAPYIDHAQATMFSIDFSKQSIFNIIRDAYKAKIKIPIYCLLRNN